MRVSKKLVRRLVREAILREVDSPEEEAEIIDVLDPCELEKMEQAEIISALGSNWPVSLGEIAGSCSSGLKFVELEYPDGQTSKIEVEEEGAEKLKLNGSESSGSKVKLWILGDLYNDGLVTPMEDKDLKTF